MVKKLSQVLAPQRLLFGGLAVMAATVVATSGVASAKQLKNTGDDPMSGPSNVQLCKDHYADFGFKNRGQCISWWNHHHGGHGYGNDNGNGHKNGHHKHHHHHFHFHFDFGHWWHKFFDN
jgi:hypothetical protein